MTEPTIPHILLAISKAQDCLKGRPYRVQQQVAYVAGLVAGLLDVSCRETTAILYAGLVLDTGLIAIAPQVAPHLPPGLDEKTFLSQHTLLDSPFFTLPGNPILSPELVRLLKSHPEAALKFLNDIPISAEVLDIVVGHQERWNGSGYPKGTKGDKIPLGARIVAFADVLVSVLEKNQGIEARRQTLREFSSQIIAKEWFDPQILTAFQKYIMEDDHIDELLRVLYTLDVERNLLRMLSHCLNPVSQRAFIDSLTVMSRMPDSLMGRYTEGNSTAVALLSWQMARKMEIPPSQAGEIYCAGLIYDIGKLGIPTQTLLRPSPLARDEWQFVYDHPSHTEAIIKGIPGFQNITTWVSEHHERLNARGYHSGKKGVDISVGGRILAIADVFQALVRPRPYREAAYEPLDALPVLNQGRGKLFDGYLLNVLRDVILSEALPGNMQQPVFS